MSWHHSALYTSMPRSTCLNALRLPSYSSTPPSVAAQTSPLRGSLHMECTVLCGSGYLLSYMSKILDSPPSGERYAMPLEPPHHRPCLLSGGIIVDMDRPLPLPVKELSGTNSAMLQHLATDTPSCVPSHVFPSLSAIKDSMSLSERDSLSLESCSR